MAKLQSKQMQNCCMTVNPLPDVHNTHILYIMYTVNIKKLENNLK